MRSGETLVLLGPSGSGKSTLLNILGGLDRATAGRVLFHGRDLTNASDQELTRYRRASVGFIFQFFNLMPSLTAGRRQTRPDPRAFVVRSDEDPFQDIGRQMLTSDRARKAVNC